MKTNKKNLFNQRQIIEKRLRSWITLRGEQPPPSGWIKAIRGSLGMSLRQLADHLGVAQSTVVMLEKREAKGTATLEVIKKAAKAMSCKLVYALVPDSPFNDLDSIITSGAKHLATQLFKKIEHSMQLEKQGGDASDIKEQVDRLAYELKEKMDSRIWNISTKIRK